MYIQALQRHGHKPLVGHFRRLNRLVRYMQRKKVGLRYIHLTPPSRLVLISDTAFRADEPDCLALRGCMVALFGKSEAFTHFPGGSFNLLDAVMGKQKKVCRSTFSAETLSLLDGAELARLIGFAFCELTLGCIGPAEIFKLDQKGQLPIQIDCVIDAMSVLSALMKEEPKTPTEMTMIIPIQIIKNLVEAGQLSSISWVDTRDMLVDGMTKGSIPREPMLAAFASCLWLVKHASKTYRKRS